MSVLPRAIGVDVGGTKTLAVSMQGHEILDEVRMPTPQGAGAVIDVVVAVIDALGGAERVGVGVAGLVDRRGRWRAAPNVAGISELDVAGELAGRVPTVSAGAVTVDNDATCATYAEWRLGAARGRRDLLVVTLGTGIGGGLVAGGRLQRGAHGLAGEIGHMVVVAGGVECVCGQRGCWERYGSGAALARFARQRSLAGTGEEVVAAAREGDPLAGEVMAEVGHWVGLGLANLANVTDPELIVIGGGLGEAGEVLLEPVRRSFAVHLYGADHRELAEIVPAALGARAGAVGAALLAAANNPDGADPDR